MSRTVLTTVCTERVLSIVQQHNYCNHIVVQLGGRDIGAWEISSESRGHFLFWRNVYEAAISVKSFLWLAFMPAGNVPSSFARRITLATVGLFSKAVLNTFLASVIVRGLESYFSRYRCPCQCGARAGSRHRNR